MKRIFTILFILIGVAVQAQNVNYTALNGPFGGTTTDLLKLANGTLVASTYSGIYTSSNAGSSWTKSNNGITDNYIYDLQYDAIAGKIYAVSYNRLYSSSDNGATWITVSSNGFQSGQKLRRSSSYFFLSGYANGTYKIYRSLTGATWSQVFSTTFSIRDIEITGGDQLLVATDGDGIYRSDVSGLSYTKLGVTEGLTTLNVNSLVISNTGTVFALTSSGPFSSANNGTLWTSIKSNIPSGETYFSGFIETDGAGNVFLLNNSSRKIYSTSNGGGAWTTLTPNYPVNSYTDIFYVDNSTTYFTSLSSLGLYKTVDSGTNWLRASSGITGLNVRNLMLADNGNLLYSYGYPSGLFVSLDDGASWDNLATGATAVTINGFVKVATNTFLGYGNGIIKTIDNGINWTTLSTTEYFEKAAFAGGNTIYGMQSYYNGTQWAFQLLKSIDLGATVTKTAITGMPASNQVSLQSTDMFLDQSGNAYIMIYNSSVSGYEIYKINLTTAQATLINSALIPAVVNSFSVLNNTIYVLNRNSNNYFLSTSTDGGATWSSVAAPGNSSNVFVINSTTFYISTYNDLYISTDSGNSWTSTGNLGTGSQANRVLISPANYSYVAVSNGPVYKSVAQVIPPAAPTALQLIGFSHSRIGLKWTDNSTNEDYFLIERSTGDNLAFDSIGTVIKNTYTNTNEFYVNSQLSQTTTYYYRVRAVGAAGKSAYSNQISGTTLTSCTASSAIPLNRSWTGTTVGSANTNILVNISNIGSPGFYQVDNLTVGANGTFSEPSTGFFIENCGSVFLYSASGNMNNGNGTWDASTKKLTIHWQTRSNAPTYRTETTVFTLNANDPTPAAPTTPFAYINTSTSSVLSWKGSNYSSQYIIQRSLTTGAGFATVGTVSFPSTTFIDVGLTTGTKYYYRILASNTTGTSAASAETSLTIQTPFFESLELEPKSTVNQYNVGSTWADLDGDKNEDLIVVSTTADTPLKIFRNKGDGTFETTTITNLSADINIRSAVAAGDYNNDGKIDLISVTTVAPATVKLWTNNGGNSFTSTDLVTLAAGYAGYTPAFADFNNDGLLDISFSSFNFSAAEVFYLFQQAPDHTFSRYELGELASDKGLAISSSWADYDNDNDADLLVDEYDYTKPARLYKNNGDGTFTKQTVAAFTTDLSMYQESSSWGDFDNDGDLDVFVGNTQPSGTLSDMLYQNNNDGTFTRLPTSAPAEILTSTYFTNGSAWGDVDNDGDLDLFVARSPISALYLNNGNATFTKYAISEYLNSGQVYDNSAGFCDYNKDGFLDLFVQRQQTVNISRNTKATGKWIEFKLIGTTSNKSGIGARITLLLPSSKKQIREITSSSGYGTTSSLTAHFGLNTTTTIPTVQINWPSGIVQTLTNVSSNQILEITEDGAGPAVLNYLPVNGAQVASTATHVAIDLNETSTAIAGKKLHVFKASDLVTAVFSADLTTATKTTNRYEFTLPVKLLTNTDYTVTIDAGAFKDIYGNSSLALAAGTWTFKTATGPLQTALSPVTNATNVAVNVPLEITFNTAVTAVAGKKIKVMNGTTAIVDADVSTNGTITGGTKYSIPAPGGNWPTITTLEVLVDAGAFIDVDQNDFAGITAGNWRFVTVDNIAPVITFDATQIPSTLESAFANINVTISVTDNGQVSSTSLYHRKISEKTFTKVNLTLTAGAWGTGINNGFADNMGFEYYFEATDNANPSNKGRLPLTDNQYFKTRISYATGTKPSFTLPSEGTKTSWRIISIPHTLQSNQVGSIFSSLGAADKTKWRLITYSETPTPQWLEGLTTIDRGKGYFVNTKDGTQITLNDASSPDFTRDKLFTVDLVKGWNQIGNPYTVPIKWEDVKSYNLPLALSDLTIFNGGYAAGNQLNIFEGGFVFVDNATPGVQIPFMGQTTSGGRKGFNQLGSDINDEEWALNLKLNQGEFTNELGSIGMASDAMQSYDNYDNATPPRFFDFLEMNFSHPEHFAKRFTRDIVPTQDNYSWEFTVDSNLEGRAELIWDNESLNGGTKEIYLLDLTRQTLINMKERGSFTFDPKESRNFKVYFGEKLKISPMRIQLGKAYPNPTSGMTTVGFSLPESGGSKQEVSLEIIDAVGRPSGVVAQGNYESGFHEVSFDAKELNNGFYTYRLTVQGLKGKTIQVNKLIIK